MCLKCSRKRDSATRQNISNDFKYQEKYTNAHRVSIFLPVFTTLLVTPARCIYVCVCYIIWWRHGHRNLSFLIFESRRYVSKELPFHFIRIYMNSSISILSKENCILKKVMFGSLRDELMFRYDECHAFKGSYRLVCYSFKNDIIRNQYFVDRNSSIVIQ